MTNQFTSRVNVSLVHEYMERGARREEVMRYVEHTAKTPGMCLLPMGGDFAYMRVAGKLHKLSIRTLVYYAATGKTPVFWPCSCKNQSCINPNHQTGAGV